MTLDPEVLRTPRATSVFAGTSRAAPGDAPGPLCLIPVSPWVPHFNVPVPHPCLQHSFPHQLLSLFSPYCITPSSVWGPIWNAGDQTTLCLLPFFHLEPNLGFCKGNVGAGQLSMWICSLRVWPLDAEGLCFFLPHPPYSPFLALAQLPSPELTPKKPARKDGPFCLRALCPFCE